MVLQFKCAKSFCIFLPNNKTPSKTKQKHTFTIMHSHGSRATNAKIVWGCLEGQITSEQALTGTGKTSMLFGMPFMHRKPLYVS